MVKKNIYTHLYLVYIPPSFSMTGPEGNSEFYIQRISMFPGFVRISIHFFEFFFTFSNACISVKTSLINTKLRDFVNLGVLFLTSQGKGHGNEVG